jgi:uncharacterized protein YeaO (DUF488 family)
MIQIKRAYEPESKQDGFRVLVDRLWPRGLKKEKLHLAAWMKELAPSTTLRKEFGHESSHWQTFQRKYKLELKAPEAIEALEKLLRTARKRNLTLVYGAHDEAHNNAVVLKKILERKLARRRSEK